MSLTFDKQKGPTRQVDMIYVLKIITVFLNILMASVFFYFARSLRWYNEPDRASIIGFVVMIVVAMLSAVLLLVG